MNIEGRSVLVTGGASGLGRAVVVHLSELGARVTALDVDQRRGRDLADQTGASFECGDVTDEARVAEVLDGMASRQGPVEILVSAAGIAVPYQRTFGRQGPYPLDVFRHVVEVNLVGSFNCARLAAAQMASNPPGKRGERGVIVQVTSISAMDGPVGSIAYTAAKAGVHGMTITMARDLGKYGIRVCTVAPGAFDTPMTRGVLGDEAESVLSDVPFPNDRLGDPVEFARFVVSICENPMLNGTTIRLDGAARLAYC